VRTRQWALRCYLERLTHKEAAFITLTYAPEHLPENGTLVRKHLQDFLKRLRRALDYHHSGAKIRFYASGEYGDETQRPHYHLLIFGFGFPDKKFHRYSHKHGFKNPVYRSGFLESLWTFGLSEVGSVTLESAAYAAGYIRKKINGAAAADHYEGRLPEFSLQSTHPGIGAEWYEQNKSWLWKEDTIRMPTAKGLRSYRPPRFFEKLYKKADPVGFAEFQLRKQLRTPLNQSGYQVEDLPEEVEDDDNFSYNWEHVVDEIPGINL